MKVIKQRKKKRYLFVVVREKELVTQDMRRTLIVRKFGVFWTLYILATYT